MAEAAFDQQQKRGGQIANPALSVSKNRAGKTSKKSDKYFSTPTKNPALSGASFIQSDKNPMNYCGTTLLALGPLGPWPISKVTFCPSVRVLKPLPWIALK
jgi:hypothetical protein